MNAHDATQPPRSSHIAVSAFLSPGLLAFVLLVSFSRSAEPSSRGGERVAGSNAPTCTYAVPEGAQLLLMGSSREGDILINLLRTTLATLDSDPAPALVSMAYEFELPDCESESIGSLFALKPGSRVGLPTVERLSGDVAMSWEAAGRTWALPVSDALGSSWQVLALQGPRYQLQSTTDILLGVDATYRKAISRELTTSHKHLLTSAYGRTMLVVPLPMLADSAHTNRGYRVLTLGGGDPSADPLTTLRLPKHSESTNEHRRVIDADFARLADESHVLVELYDAGSKGMEVEVFRIEMKEATVTKVGYWTGSASSREEPERSTGAGCSAFVRVVAAEDEGFVALRGPSGDRLDTTVRFIPLHNEAAIPLGATPSTLEDTAKVEVGCTVLPFVGSTWTGAPLVASIRSRTLSDDEMVPVELTWLDGHPQHTVLMLKVPAGIPLESVSLQAAVGKSQICASVVGPGLGVVSLFEESPKGGSIACIGTDNGTTEMR